MPTENETRPPAAVSSALRRLRGLPQKLADKVLATRKRIAAIQEDADLTLEAQMRQMEEQREGLMSAADDVEAAAVEALTAVEGTAEKARASEGDPASELLHENRLQRAWARLRSLLDAGREPLDLASEAEKASDRLAFDALREELPTWLAAHNRQTEIEPTMAAVAEREAHLRTPAEQAMADAIATAKRLRETVATDVGLVRVDQETCAELYVLGEDGKTTPINIAPETPTTGGPVQ